MLSKKVLFKNFLKIFMIFIIFYSFLDIFLSNYLSNINILNYSISQDKQYIEDSINNRLNNIVVLINNSYKINVLDLDIYVDITDKYNYIKDYKNKNIMYKIKKFIEHYNNKNVFVNLTYDKSKLIKTLRNSLSFLNQEPINAKPLFNEGKISFESDIIGKEPNIELFVDTLITELQNRINDYSNTDNIIQVNLEFIENSPDIKLDDIKNSCDLLGRSVTTFSSGAVNRNKNIKNAINKIDGVIIFPNKSFSMYKNTAPFTVENGYSSAEVIKGEELTDDVGGGVCQVTTTLYNAVIRSELDVITRYNHSYPSSYVDKGFDATIASNKIDMCFVNNTNYPIIVHSYIDNFSIICEIYGKEYRDSNRKIEFHSFYDEKDDVWVLYKYIYIDDIYENRININTSKYK